jgi:hypothetical protein
VASLGNRTSAKERPMKPALEEDEEDIPEYFSTLARISASGFLSQAAKKPVRVLDGRAS